jgi:hypothetical protein
MHTVGAIPILASTASSSNCLIVTKTLYFFFAFYVTTKSESQIIAISLTGSTSPEGF